MAGISITLSSLDDYKTINVEGLGILKVRRESSNQGLKSSENVRDIFKLQDEAKKLEKKSAKLLKDGLKDDDPEIIKLNAKATDKLEQITEIRKSEHEMRKSRIFDDEDGRLVNELFERATDEDIAKLLALAENPESSKDD